jgi:hypothetical protein
MNTKRQKSILIIIILTLYINNNVFSQSSRINTYQAIGWYNYFGTLKLSNKLRAHTEYQWRRNNVITNWQQSLLRVGLNYQPNPRVLFRVGYAWVETFPYGEISINNLGRDFTEHRIFQMVQLSHKESIIDFSHRFMLEQRFVGRYSTSSFKDEDEFPLLQRMRYMFKLQLPLIGNEMKDKTPYLSLYDEILIGFGKNVNANIFDQNRLGVLLGYLFNKNVRLEVGYLNQVIQFGRQINSQSIFQNNNGLIVNAIFNLDLTKSLNKIRP